MHRTIKTKACRLLQAVLPTMRPCTLKPGTCSRTKLGQPWNGAVHYAVRKQHRQPASHALSPRSTQPLLSSSHSPRTWLVPIASPSPHCHQCHWARPGIQRGGTFHFRFFGCNRAAVQGRYPGWYGRSLMLLFPMACAHHHHPHCSLMSPWHVPITITPLPLLPLASHKEKHSVTAAAQGPHPGSYCCMLLLLLSMACGVSPHACVAASHLLPLFTCRSCIPRNMTENHQCIAQQQPPSSTSLFYIAVAF